MDRIYDNERIAQSYDAGRGAPAEGLENWRLALSDFLPFAAPLLDLGSGTGIYARLLQQWFNQQIVGLEPSKAMLTQATMPNHRKTDRIAYARGRAEQIPLAFDSCGGAWLSTMLHHVDDINFCARELRRVVRADGLIMIRGVFPGGQRDIALYEFFPAAGEVIDSFPSRETIWDVFGAAGFKRVTGRRIKQYNAVDLSEYYKKVRQRTNTSLLAISDDEFKRGLERLRKAAAERPPAPVESIMELIVLA